MLDITTLAAWGEFIGGIAVVVSLIYLASQIRQNSRLVRASARSSHSQHTASANLPIIQDEDVARIYWDGLADRNSLSESDRRRFDPLLSLQIRITAEQFEFSRDEIGSARLWEEQEAGFLWQVQQPGLRQWWGEWRTTFSDDFRDYVEGLIREGEAGE